MSPGKVLLLAGILDGPPEVGLAGKRWEGAAPTYVQTLPCVAAIRLELLLSQLLSDASCTGQGLHTGSETLGVGWRWGEEKKSTLSLPGPGCHLPTPNHLLLPFPAAPPANECSAKPPGFALWARDPGGCAPGCSLSCTENWALSQALCSNPAATCVPRELWRLGNLQKAVNH